MSKYSKVCIDRLLPGDEVKPRRIIRSVSGERAIISPDKLWPNGSSLNVLFMEGSDSQKKLVIDDAREWEKWANIKFDFSGNPDSEIRITFNESGGAWSYIGTDATSISLSEPTMNLGFLDGGTVLHEFGHAIGLHHEHQNPKGGIEWNEEEVIKSLSGPPNEWSEDRIRHNVLKKYTADQVKGSEFDPDSIMLYFFPDSWVQNGEGTSSNEAISIMDKEFIGGLNAYPKNGNLDIPSLPITRLSSTSASIGQPGEEDLFKFMVENPGRYTIETRGRTDLIMKLYGPNSRTTLISSDDDGGEGVNPRIVADLPAGEYLVQVRHYNESAGTGQYEVLLIV